MAIESSSSIESDAQRRSAIEPNQLNWSLEMDGAAMYSALAERERIPERKSIFIKLAALERKHAGQWAERLRSLGGEVPSSHSGKRHATRDADTPAGMQQMILAIEAEERRDVAGYLRHLQKEQDEKTGATLPRVILDEYAHAHELKPL